MGDGGAEPPPAHHDFAVFGRLLECPLQARQVTGLIGILYDSATKPASERGQHQNSYNEAMSVRMNHRLDAWEREAGLSYSTHSLDGANMPFPAFPKNPTAGTPKSLVRIYLTNQAVGCTLVPMSDTQEAETKTTEQAII